MQTKEYVRSQRNKPTYVEILESVIEKSDIILEILDIRFAKEMRSKEIEEKIKEKGKKIIYVLNKIDLANKKTIQKNLNQLQPSIAVSAKNRKNIGKLRNFLKQNSKKVKVQDRNVIVGVIGYPNSGKSSIINLLIGRSSAGTSSEAGFTKSMQKLKLSQGISLLDSPGVIPSEQYSEIDTQKISQHAKLGGRHYSKVKDPEMTIHLIMREHPGVLEDFYNIDAKGDSEKLLEQLGRKKGQMKPGGKVDEDKTAREILKDWQEGKIKI